jgi:hypothetical protein
MCRYGAVLPHDEETAEFGKSIGKEPRRSGIAGHSGAKFFVAVVLKSQAKFPPKA